MNYVKTLFSAFLAGISISLGGVAFLSLENKVLGALFFSCGLFCVCSFGFHLFTGKVCYVFEKDRAYLLSLPVIWIGNFLGALFTALLVRATRLAPLCEKAAALCAAKTADSFLSLFLLGALCNVFIYIGVEGYRTIPYEIGKYIALFFGVTVFILCGYEHSVADMFYFSLAGMLNGDTLLRLLVITLGNAAGGVSIPLLRKFIAGK